jgi:regulator of sirC expression with transglutaminase-like and TPR domain
MELDTALRRLRADPDAPLDVAEVSLCLARDEYPDLDVAGYLSELDAMAHEVKPRLRGGLETRLEALCRYLFHDLGFRGNREEYYDPRNSYLNDVIDRRTGLPIALSALAMAVGRRAGMEVAGVGLPGHFVARASAGKRVVIFDPFNGGRPLTRQDCEKLVEQVTGEPFRTTAAVLRPVPLGVMVTRMMNNLKAVYLGAEDFRRAVRVMERLRQLNPDDLLQRRDLGAALIRAGQPGRAIDHLRAYLDAAPAPADADAVRELLAQARGAVASWN